MYKVSHVRKSKHRCPRVRRRNYDCESGKADGSKSSTTSTHASSVDEWTGAFPVSGTGRFERIKKRSSEPLWTKREIVAALNGGRRTSNAQQYNTRTHTHTHGRGITIMRYLLLSQSKCECVKHDVHSLSRVTRTHQHKYTQQTIATSACGAYNYNAHGQTSRGAGVRTTRTAVFVAPTLT